jgi:hypothetical protein
MHIDRRTRSMNDESVVIAYLPRFSMHFTKCKFSRKPCEKLEICLNFFRCFCFKFESAPPIKSALEQNSQSTATRTLVTNISRTKISKFTFSSRYKTWEGRKMFKIIFKLFEKKYFYNFMRNATKLNL